MNPSSQRHAARWPFWLLIVAWVCANSPQPATYALLTWMAEARSFAHQQRLSVGVAYLLAGEKVPSGVVETGQLPAEQPTPAVPGDAVLKKLSLALERGAESLPPVRRAEFLRLAAVELPEAMRPPPLLGPPRTNLG